MSPICFCSSDLESSLYNYICPNPEEDLWLTDHTTCLPVHNYYVLYAWDSHFSSLINPNVINVTRHFYQCYPQDIGAGVSSSWTNVTTVATLTRGGIICYITKPVCCEGTGTLGYLLLYKISYNVCSLMKPASCAALYFVWTTVEHRQNIVEVLWFYMTSQWMFHLSLMWLHVNRLFELLVSWVSI